MCSQEGTDPFIWSNNQEITEEVFTFGPWGRMWPMRLFLQACRVLSMKEIKTKCKIVMFKTNSVFKTK